MPVAQIDDTGTEVVTYLHTDHLLTTRLATDNSGQVVWRWEGEAFGRTPAIELAGVRINLRFPGQYFDEETRLHYNHFRYYDPQIGRYITSDPVGLDGGPNSFVYGASNGLKNIDPTGELAGPLGAFAGGLCTLVTGGSFCEVIVDAASGFFGPLGGALVGQAGAQACNALETCDPSFSGDAAGIAAGGFVGGQAGGLAGSGNARRAARAREAAGRSTTGSHYRAQSRIAAKNSQLRFAKSGVFGCVVSQLGKFVGASI